MLALLERSVDEMAEAAAAGHDERFVAADIDFHEALLRGTGNAVMAQFADTVSAVLRTRVGDAGHTLHAHTDVSIGNHRALAQAIRDRDADAAERWARKIVRETLTEFEARAPGEPPRHA
jgi:DNA-binding FadR family transcriptional regulator